MLFKNSNDKTARTLFIENNENKTKTRKEMKIEKINSLIIMQGCGNSKILYLPRDK